MIALTIFFRYNGPKNQYEVNEVRPLIKDMDEHLAIIMGAALRLAHIVSAGVPGLLGKTTLAKHGSELYLDLRNNSALFKSGVVEKLLKRLADVMEIKFSIKV